MTTVRVCVCGRNRGLFLFYPDISMIYVWGFSVFVLITESGGLSMLT